MSQTTVTVVGSREEDYSMVITIDGKRWLQMEGELAYLPPRVNDIRPIGKPTNIHDSLRNKKPYVQEHVLLNYDDWKTIESV